MTMVTKANADEKMIEIYIDKTTCVKVYFAKRKICVDAPKEIEIQIIKHKANGRTSEELEQMC